MTGGRCTVIGASGFVGGHLVERLSRSGFATWSPGRGDEAIFSRHLGHVFYCAGLTADFRSRPFDTIRAHVTLLSEVLERSSFDSLTYLSSTRVYARCERAQEDSAIVVQPEDFSDLYNLSKLAGESLCHAAPRGRVRVVRLSNVIGWDPGSENLLCDLLRQADAGCIRLGISAGSQKDYVAIEDVLEMLPRIALDGTFDCYNLAGGVQTSVEEVTALLARRTGCRVEYESGARQVGFPLIAIDRLQAEFGYVATPFVAAFERMMDAGLEDLRGTAPR